MPQMTLLPRYGAPGPVDAEGFNVEQDEIKRRRLQLEALLAEPKLTGVAGGIANLALGLTKGYHEGNLREQEQDLARRKSDYAQQWLEKMPALKDTPAQAEVNPSMPAAGEEGPPLPTTYRQAAGGMVPQPPTYEHKDATPFLPLDLRKLAQWTAEGASLGPGYSAIGAMALKEGLENRKGGGDKWEIAEIFDDKTGQPRKVWVNKSNPAAGTVPIGGTQFKEPKDSALTERTKTADEMLRSRFPGKSDDWYKTNAQGLALGDIVITQDANGGVNVSSKAGAISGLGGPGAPPAAGTAASPPMQPGAAPTRIPPAVQSGRDAGRIAILQKEYADEAANPNAELGRKNQSAIASELKQLGVTAGAPAAPDSPDAKYRQDERNRPYLPPEGIPGATMSTSKAHIDKLNKDVKSLADDYTKQKLPELITAANQAETKIKELAGNGTSGINLDNGKLSGNVPGFGGPLGAANVLPALTEDGRAMRLAMEPLKNIMLSARSGAAVSDQELNRLLREMGQSLNQGDPQFWTAYNNFKERLSAIDSGVTGGYAPIVRDTYFSRPDAQRPVWGSGGGGGAKAAPSSLRSKYNL